MRTKRWASIAARFSALGKFFAPNQTVMVDVVLQRRVVKAEFALTQDLEPQRPTKRRSDPLSGLPHRSHLHRMVG
jgi:hypothetical protein